ncbi:WecB/TagA/CpsF family glycosyltransferase [Anabaena cylindrica FACHB-243]|uniref:N-acetylmannosaminyltransferase n=1 Tax=Anabaena cylindrica (strain ATCC 27899 / PCC 7122) TaxID=272123 RepID=K9ZG28_ANACC|nr:MULTISPECIES: WecB/TagA/CpsF family glycosyltransferase [Anabaena]AFZ58178.1 N-acetylmannosaminyltransferase [Anabaena cylindrica PCC 7122]MBD2419046.1 WecB/TagA/CpsF family glycosyltransferase [Anabaena cylindrica FACHB-243]MBY5281194.1 WecB/TagA/CpsF family glycosyltransferase [Anabaena sp. CCAP 1446/1C]MBY5310263.1 WecB/TagA/CpsF family glycosyltransferase [Anabaena sp. CCAP 1446/1C]MCM2409514.1 WecB/TagA/CpsF family glycosyltransferase [Anabaena sp. CCAP 1446/1C]
MYKSPLKFSVLGLPVHVMNNYPNWLLECLEQGKGTHVVTLNAEMTMQAERNSSLAGVIQNADLVIPDGAGVVLYLQCFLRQEVQRCPGIELSENLLQELGQLETAPKVFFYGGAPGVAATAAEFWQQQVPGLNIAGTHSGYHSPEEEEILQHTLTQLEPQVIFVGLGVPRQELWIAKNRHWCPQAIWIGVGGSFDIWAGTKTRAPRWLANNNLEWLYRLYQEPWRWRRMLALPEFALKACVYRLTVRSINGAEC